MPPKDLNHRKQNAHTTNLPQQNKIPETARGDQAASGPIGWIMQMQRVYGNQAVQKMMQSYSQGTALQKQTLQKQAIPNYSTPPQADDPLKHKESADPIQRKWATKMEPKDTTAPGGESAFVPPIQRALIRDQEILDQRTNTFNWVSFRGRRDNADPKKKATELGRQANLDSGGTSQTRVDWSPVDPISGEGTKMEAIVGPDHNLGSGPSEKNAVTRVAAFRLLSGKSYISGHLLNEKLGGPGNDGRNLTAIPQKANSLDETNIEQYVRDPVNEEGAWYKYIVDVDYTFDSKVYDIKFDNFTLNQLKDVPSGLVWKAVNANQTKVELAYASKLKAQWYQLNTTGGRFGPEYKRNIAIESPLAGSSAALEQHNAGISQDKPLVPGTEAKTTIDPEELVLTTSNLLKSVVENREGLIARLQEIRVHNADLLENNEELQDLVYQYGYEWGYEDGSGEDGVYQDEGKYGKYSEGYLKGFQDGDYDKRQYTTGQQHGSEDGYNALEETEHSKYQNEENSGAYDEGYNQGVLNGRYQYFYELGEEDGKQRGLDDVAKFYNREEDGYQEGYDAGYAQGQWESPFRQGMKYVFHGITLAYDQSAITQNALQSFNGVTFVELTGTKFNNFLTTWYQVRLIESTNDTLKAAKGQTGWMNKKWLNKGE